jgi:hypothetical protein
MLFIVFVIPRPRLVDYIKLDLKAIDLESADWIDMAEGRRGRYVFREGWNDTLGFMRVEKFYDWETKKAFQEICSIRHLFIQFLR